MVRMSTYKRARADGRIQTGTDLRQVSLTAFHLHTNIEEKTLYSVFSGLYPSAGSGAFFNTHSHQHLCFLGRNFISNEENANTLVKMRAYAQNVRIML